jgi:two-component system OmpR family sensor kinase/two-component system sensor histidine kinase BaeS
VTITIALALTAWLIEWRTGVAYLGYFDETQAAQLSALAEQAAQQFAATGDWQQVQSWLSEVSFPMMGGQMGMGQMGAGQMGTGRNGMGMGNMMGRSAEPAFLLVDPQTGQTLAASGGAAIVVDADAMRRGVPVVLDGTTVALIVSQRAPAHMGRAEETLLAQVRTAILLSAAIAGAVALVIGALLVASVLQPLRAVERVVSALAGGNLTARVVVQGQDDIANLGSAVNHMAETLQAQESLRQRLVSDVAHELRTPLSVIQGNLQAILDGVYPLNTEEIRTVLGETQLLSRLVTDLHELAQAEAGRLPLQRQSLSVSGLLVHLADLYTPLARQKGIDLRVESPPARWEVYADPDRLQQIFHNLVGNALRHTNSGETVHIRATVEAQTDGGRAQNANRSAIRFTIQDTGSGIHPADLPYVFERFYRGETNRPRSAEHATGAGLGLAIAKALVQAHGGAIGVFATMPHGATFWFTLPTTSTPDA